MSLLCQNHQPHNMMLPVSKCLMDICIKSVNRHVFKTHLNVTSNKVTLLQTDDQELQENPEEIFLREYTDKNI